MWKRGKGGAEKKHHWLRVGMVACERRRISSCNLSPRYFRRQPEIGLRSEALEVRSNCKP